MTENTATPEERPECEHHWVSHHQPGLPIPWIEQCSMCGWFNSAELGRQIAAKDAAVLTERDALAAILTEAPHWFGCAAQFQRGPCRCWKSRLPADALAARDSGIWDDGHKAGWYDRDGDVHVGLVPSGYAQDAPNPYRRDREAG